MEMNEEADDQHIMSPERLSAASSTSSSSTSSSDEEHPEPPEPVAPDAAQQLEPVQQQAVGAEEPRQEPQGDVQRRRHEESFAWGRFFYITRVRGKNSWQGLCRYHASAGPGTKRNKTVSWKANDDDDKVLALKRLKKWCLSAPESRTREGHQGGRGLPPADEELRRMPAERLDHLETLLPMPEE